jgi:hypothetical protein
MLNSVQTVMCAVLGTALLLDPLSRNKFGLLSWHYRMPIRIATFVLPTWGVWRYFRHQKQRSMLFMSDKYGDRLAALEFKQDCTK